MQVCTAFVKPRPGRTKMAGQSGTFKVIVLIAIRNLVASRLKTFIVGGIIFFGAFLVVMGTSLLDSIDLSMSRSIIGSVAGHIQVYSHKSKDPLEVIGSMNFDDADLDPIDDFASLRRTLEAVPNVKSVVPMGISGAMVTSGNSIDLALASLRDNVRKLKNGDTTAVNKAAYEAGKDHVQQIVSVVSRDLANITKIQNEKALSVDERAAVARAASPEFWTGFDKDPLDALEFLDNQLAPLATDADMLFLRYVGTDIAAFSQSFDRMRIVDGTAIPPGEHGFMFAKYTYEDQLKLKTARRLDKIKEAMANRKVTIAQDDDLRRLVTQNVTQVREIELQLDRPKVEIFRKKLQAHLGTANEPDVSRLLATFFATDDQNFATRYDFFYKELAPHLEMYRVRVGDTLTIKAFTKSGYVQSISLKVFGTFTFAGLEGSPQAGQLNLMDMVSFRELYGFLTDEKRNEIEALKKSVTVKDVTRESVEADLFGSKSTEETGPGRTIEAEATPGLVLSQMQGLAGKLKREDMASRIYDRSQLQEGVVLNSAVILQDPKRIEQTMAAIEAAGVSAGLPLKAISWQTASGLLGQFVTMARIVLFTAVLIIFVVALVIINNALVMATLERVREIGTLRAVGAQKRFILLMLVIEALVVGVVFGALGALSGAGLLTFLGKTGIAAPNDIAMFFFSGPRLYPGLGSTSLVVALAIVLLVSAVSSLYPAFLAMRVSPLEAMQGED